MKYYKITDKSIDLEQKLKGLVADIPSANGEFVPSGKEYFDRMGKGEIIENAPIFDYFHLQSFGPKEEWEWKLQDIHGFIGEYPTGGSLYISDDFKILLENFRIAPKYHFYETRLLYKGKKLKYWIFQFPIEALKNFDYEKSDFVFKDEEKIYHFVSDEDYFTFRSEEYRKTKRKLFCSKLCLKDNFDIVYTINNGNIVSEKLKTAIETMGLEGFLFSKLDYEVIVE